jgi:hypothetical protein
VSGFSADWLTLREPYDLRARSREVIAAVAASVAALPSVHVVDLARTGATVRADGASAVAAGLAAYRQ